MKKLLALVLALVMTLSLCVTSNAAFDDAADIQHDEAVDVLTTLGVIAGKGNNKFDPAANVTRAEMAKMISIIMLGDVDAAAFVGTSTGLKDIAGHWAEGYIQYCYSQGIIAGKGNGLFDPNANVTAVEAAKMLLGAIGYNAKVQGYTGADWQINVTRDAQLSGFYAELKGLAATKALSRDEAAQMIYNTVVADLIEKTPSLNINTGSIEYTYKPNPAKDLMRETFDAIKVEGIVTANEYVTLDSTSALKAGKTTVTVTNNDEQNVWSGNVTFNVSTGAEELGKEVVLYVKKAASSTAASKATVLGKAFLSSNNVVATTDAKFTKASKLDSFLEDAGLKTTLPTNVWYQNGVKKVATFTYSDAKNGYVTEFIDNDNDGTVEYVLQTAYDFGKVTYYSAANETIVVSDITNGVTVKYTEKDDVNGFEDVAKDDYVVYAEVGGVLYVEKAQTVSGKITSYSTADSTVSLDGTAYKISGVKATLNGGTLTAPAAATNFVESMFYLDKCGYVCAVDTTAVTNYCVVYGYNGGLNGLDVGEKVSVLFADGTTGTYKLDKTNAKNNATALTSAAAAGTSLKADKAFLATYTLDGDEIILNGFVGVLDTAVTTSLKYTSGKSLLWDNNTTLKDSAPHDVYVTKDTVFFYVYADAAKNVSKVKAYAGSEAPSINLTNAPMYEIAVNGTNHNVKAIAIYVTAADVNNVGTKANYMYVVKTLASNDGSDTVVAILDGEVKTDLLVKGAYSLGLNSYSVEDGKYKLQTLGATASYVELAKVTGTSVVIGSKEYKVTAETEIAVLDGKDSYMIELGDLVANDNVIVYDEATADDTLEAIYVVEQYDSTHTSLLAVKDTANTQYVAASKLYETKETTVANVEPDYVFSHGVTVKVVANDTVTTLTQAIGAGNVAGPLVAGTEYDLIVISESGTEFAKYDLKCVAALS